MAGDEASSYDDAIGAQGSGSAMAAEPFDFGALPGVTAPVASPAGLVARPIGQVPASAIPGRPAERGRPVSCAISCLRRFPFFGQ